MSLSEKKRKLYEKFLRKEINFMEYINKKNDLDKEFIKKLKKELNDPLTAKMTIDQIIDTLAGSELAGVTD